MHCDLKVTLTEAPTQRVTLGQDQKKVFTNWKTTSGFENFCCSSHSFIVKFVFVGSCFANPI